MDPFKKKQEDVALDEAIVSRTIKDKLNAPRKQVKFTWEGLKKALPLFDTSVFSPQKLKRIKELTEGAPAKENDYIEGFEEIERSLYGGMQDLGYSIGDLVTSGIDYAFDTDYVSKLDEAYEENKIKDPETLVGEFGKLGVQFGIPGGLVFKIGARGRAIAKGKDAVNKLSKAQKVTQVAKRAGYMAGAFAATDFLAASPGMQTLVVEKEDEGDKSGRDLALTRFKNRLRFASEGALIGGGFSLMGKPLAVGLKYGLFKPGAYVAGMGLKAADKAVVTPLSFVLSRTPGVPTGIKKLRNVSAFTAEKLLNPIVSRNLKLNSCQSLIIGDYFQLQIQTH